MGWKERPADCSEHSWWHSVQIKSIWSAKNLSTVAVHNCCERWNRGKPNKKRAKEKASSAYLRGCTPSFASKTMGAFKHHRYPPCIVFAIIRLWGEMIEMWSCARHVKEEASLVLANLSRLRGRSSGTSIIQFSFFFVPTYISWLYTEGQKRMLAPWSPDHPPPTKVPCPN